MKYRIKATKEIVELRTWKRDDGAIKLVDKYGKMEFWPDEVEPAEQLGWHPASETPKLDEDDDNEFIVIASVDNELYRHGPMIDKPKKAMFIDGQWTEPNVKWWCYPPKED